MGRRQLYSTDQMLDAARDAVALHGRQATLAQVCELSGAPSGSIYHRFGSRDEIMARLWLRSIHRFHDRLREIAEQQVDAGETLVDMAVVTVRYCRQFPAEALAMTLFRQERLMAGGPENLREEVEHVNDKIFALLGQLAAQRFPHLVDDPRLLMFAFTSVVGLCYGLIRPFVVEQQPIPAWLDDVIREGCRAALGVGDTWAQTPPPGEPDGNTP